MTDDQLNAIQARADAATNGPWTTTEPTRDADGWAQGVVVASVAPRQSVYGSLGGIAPEANRRFIANARQDVPTLLAEVRRLRAMVERLMGLGPDGKTAHALY